MASDLLTSPQWRRTRLAVLERDGWRCRINGPRCAGRADAVDHIVPREFGGAELDPANLRAACTPCNSGRRPGGSRAGRAELSLSREW